MRLTTPLTLAALLALTCPAAAQEGQKQDEQVIEEFVGTRGVSFEEPGKKPKRQPPPRASSRGSKASAGKGSASASGRAAAGKGGAAGKATKAGGSEAGARPADDAAAEYPKAGGAGRALALGYTILLKDDGGRLSVVDAQKEFKTGDRFAVALETNADGYLYMFSAENGRNPELLFPNAQIDGGANAVAAHARASFPTTATAGEEHFIEFTDPPAAEHLFIIFSRRPLADVPAGEALVKFCGQSPEDCAWRPTAAQWARITGGAKGRGVTEAKNPQLVAREAAPAATPGTLRRGLKVRKEDPRPAVVRVNDSTDAEVLVTEIVLTHK
ncbi:MAG TPA: DUF4384 domain-containing protein [Pyrinomonadaceae bacterium]